MLRAIFIDVHKQAIEAIMIEDSLRSVQAQIGCGSIERVPFDEKGHWLYFDEEGIMNNKGLRFMVNSWAAPLIGNGLILGSTPNGEAWSDADESIEYYLSNIAFFIKDVNPDGY